jgi:hypothetical protein
MTYTTTTLVYFLRNTILSPFSFLFYPYNEEQSYSINRSPKSIVKTIRDRERKKKRRSEIIESSRICLHFICLILLLSTYRILKSFGLINIESLMTDMNFYFKDHTYDVLLTILCYRVMLLAELIDQHS